MRTSNQDEQALRDHVFLTYIALRYGMAILGIAFPVLLWVVGKLLYGIELQPSMSHYYFAPYPESPGQPAFPMRAVFVGLLFAIGTGLFLYKGFTNWENVALNFAGVFAVLVALFPMNIDCTANCGASLHGTFAILLFLCLAFVAVFCAGATLAYLPSPDERARFGRLYRLLGACMLLSPLAALALTLATSDRSRLIFFLEAFGVWAFAAYWWTKSREMAKSSAELDALAAKLQPPRRRRGRILPEFVVGPPKGPDTP
jgi:hypothetical protein